MPGGGGGGLGKNVTKNHKKTSFHLTKSAILSITAIITMFSDLRLLTSITQTLTEKSILETNVCKFSLSQKFMQPNDEQIDA